MSRVRLIGVDSLIFYYVGHGSRLSGPHDILSLAWQNLTVPRTPFCVPSKVATALLPPMAVTADDSDSATAAVDGSRARAERQGAEGQHHLPALESQATADSCRHSPTARRRKAILGPVFSKTRGLKGRTCRQAGKRVHEGAVRGPTASLAR